MEENDIKNFKLVLSKFEKEGIPNEHYTIYFSIAYQNYKELVDNAKFDINLLDKKYTNGIKKDFKKILTLKNNLKKNYLIFIVFLSMCIESFINDYGLSHFSKNYFYENLDKLSTLSKIKLFPKLVNGNDINIKNFKFIQELFKLRNEFVHFKTQKTYIIKKKDYIEFEYAKSTIIKVDEIMKIFKAFEELILEFNKLNNSSFISIINLIKKGDFII